MTKTNITPDKANVIYNRFIEILEAAEIVSLASLGLKSRCEIHTVFCIQAANSFHSQWKSMDDLIEWAMEAQWVMVSLCGSVATDEEYKELRRHEPGTSKHLFAKSSIITKSLDYEFAQFTDDLPIEMILNFCKKVGSENRLYWFKVYERLGLICPAELDSRTSQEQESGDALHAAEGALDRGDSRLAMDYYDKAIGLNHKNSEAYFKRGLVHHLIKDQEKCIADCTEVIRLDAKNSKAYLLRASAHTARSDFEKAIKDISEAIRLNPNNPKAYLRRGNAYKSTGKVDMAIADYTESIRLNENDHEVYEDRGFAYQRMGNLDAAILDYNKVIKLDPKNALVHRRRGGAYHSKGEYGKAIADLKEAIKLDPKSAYALNLLAWTLSTCVDPAHRDSQKAVEYAKTACDISKWKDHNHVDTLAAALAESGDFEQAIFWVKKSLEIPDISVKEVTAARQRLALYQCGTAYRDV